MPAHAQGARSAPPVSRPAHGLPAATCRPAQARPRAASETPLPRRFALPLLPGSSIPSAVPWGSYQAAWPSRDPEAAVAAAPGRGPLPAPRLPGRWYVGAASGPVPLPDPATVCKEQHQHTVGLQLRYQLCCSATSAGLAQRQLFTPNGDGLRLTSWYQHPFATIQRTCKQCA